MAREEKALNNKARALSLIRNNYEARASYKIILKLEPLAL